jgi:hypothetical protein
MKNEEITSTTREILLREWDPCGVGDNNALMDEYDQYLPAIVALVIRRSSSAVMNQTLIELEKELGVALPEEQRERVVRSLLAIRP